MRRLAAATVLLAGCGCPRTLCAQWLVFTVAADPWTAGVLRVDAVVGDREVHCTIEVPGDALPPTPQDIACNEGVIADGYTFDTAGNVDPDVLELRLVTGWGDDPPAVAEVAVTRVIEGADVVVIDDVVVLDWDVHPPTGGTCAGGCASAVVPLVLAVSPS